MVSKIKQIYQGYVCEYKLHKSFLILLVISAGIFLPVKPQTSFGQEGSNAAVISVSPVHNGIGATPKPGETIRWNKTVDTSQTVSRTDGTFVETINQGQKFAGNLDLPKGWSAEYSTDAIGTPPANRTYIPYDTTDGAYSTAQLGAMTYLRINTGNRQTLKPSTTASILQPLDAKEMDLADEDYLAGSPILYNEKIYMLLRGERAATGVKTFDCFDMVLYERCAGFPTYFSSSNSASPQNQTALGTGTVDISTPYYPNVVLDTGEYDVDGLVEHEGWMYFPGQRGNEYGVVCVNLNDLTNCGFTSMGSSAAPSLTAQNPALISGFVQSGPKIYGHANDADRTFQTMICFNIVAQARCDDYSDTTTGPAHTYLISEHAGSYDTPGNHLMIGDKLYWLVNYRVGNSNIVNIFPPGNTQREFGTRLFCFDVVQKTACAGYTRPIRFYDTFGIERPTGLFIWKKPNQPNPDHAICLVTSLASSFDPNEECFNPDTGATLGGPVADRNPGVNQETWLLTPWHMAPSNTTITDENGHLKTYFPYYKTGDNSTIGNTLNFPPSKGGTACFDWTTQSDCYGFGVTKTTQNPETLQAEFIYFGFRYWHEINDGYGGDMGYVYDGSCMWGFGYSGHIWSFDPMTADMPCRKARLNDSYTISADDYYCDGQQRSLTWGRARLTKARLNDFESLNVTVTDPATGNVLVQGDIKQLGQDLSLEGLSFSEYPELDVDMEAVMYNTTPWANGNTPYLGLIANSSGAQYCYDTTIPIENCDVSSVATTSRATLITEADTLANSKSQSIVVTPDADKQCFKDLRAQLQPDKTLVRENETITYNLTVNNKANPDPENRGNIQGAAYSLTIPTGFSFVSATGGGVVSGNKVVWNGKTINAATTDAPSVTLRVDQAVTARAELQDAQARFTQNVYAAEQQESVTIRADVTYEDDVYKTDNTANSTITVVRTVPDPVEEPDPETPPTDPETEEPTTESPPTDPETEEPEWETDTDGVTIITDISGDDDEPDYTPGPIKKIIPEPVKKQVELFFSTLYGIVTPIPKGVALAIPYITITILAVFTLAYTLLISKERENRRKLRKLKVRFEQTESARKDYVNIVSHYLNTPITTMKLILETIKNTTKVSKQILQKANKDILKLSGDVESLIAQSNVAESSTVTKRVFAQRSTKSAFGIDLVAIVIGVLFFTVIVNAVFIWAGRYDINTTHITTQTLYFVLAVGMLTISFRSFRHTKLANQVIEQELAYEQQLASTQSSFIADASQVLSKDLQTMDGYTNKIAAAPRTKPYVESIDSLKDIVGRLLAINSLVKKQRLSDAVSEDVGDIVIGVIKALRPAAEKRLIELSMYVEPDMKTTISREDMELILSSVIDNAVKFNEDGGLVDVIAKRKGQSLVSISVKDTGRGIEKDKLETLFAPFSRATGTLEFNYGGIGLDLYTVKLTVEHYGGRLRIDSVPEKGTTVYIELPLL